MVGVELDGVELDSVSHVGGFFESFKQTSRFDVIPGWERGSIQVVANGVSVVEKFGWSFGTEVSVMKLL